MPGILGAAEPRRDARASDVTRTLLVTNDFAPKLGGIQSYLEELWRRLDAASVSVLTASSHPDAASFDARARDQGRRRLAAPRHH